MVSGVRKEPGERKATSKTGNRVGTPRVMTVTAVRPNDFLYSRQSI